MDRHRPAVALLMGLFLGIVLLHAAALKRLVEGRFEDLALGQENTFTYGSVSGVRIHCHDLDDLNQCLRGYEDANIRAPVVLWLGNSQLHGINQFAPGQETASSLLHRSLREQGSYALTLSQPNANLIEHYVLFAHLAGRLPIDTLVLSLVFDDMREEGVRTSLSATLKDAQTVEVLKDSDLGRDILPKSDKQGAASDDKAALVGTMQDRYERALDGALGGYWPLWRERSALQGHLFLFLYQFRNWVFGITPSSTRKIIPGRYALNREALKAILYLAGTRGVRVLLYIAPLRNDVKIPYDRREYLEFKREMAALSAQPHVRFVDFEDLVPAQFWGSKDSTSLGGGAEVDFMHFRADGHRLLADAVSAQLGHLRRPDNRR